MNENETLVKLMKDMGEGVEKFKSKYDGRVANMEKQLNAIETAVARGQLPGGGGSSLSGFGSGIDPQATREHR
ncbi:MAG TPA: hypothetical protein PK114_06970, partial [Smithellaceae bacterium]|nr:hypothetical protein [Smithellaceae bacterium]